MLIVSTHLVVTNVSVNMVIMGMDTIVLVSIPKTCQNTAKIENLSVQTNIVLPSTHNSVS